MTKISSYIVESSSSKISYTVKYDHEREHYTCTCPDYIHRCSKTNEMCKHIQKIKTDDDNLFRESCGELKKEEEEREIGDILLDVVTNQQAIIKSNMTIISTLLEKLTL